MDRPGEDWTTPGAALRAEDIDPMAIHRAYSHPLAEVRVSREMAEMIRSDVEGFERRLSAVLARRLGLMTLQELEERLRGPAYLAGMPGAPVADF